jgi:hypothetical protein
MLSRVLWLTCVSWLLAGPAAAGEEAWLDDLYDQVAADLRAGKPLVVHAHVPL